MIAKLREYNATTTEDVDTNIDSPFDKEGSDTPVSYIRYSENLDINSIKDKIKRYEHVFKYESDHYIWISTEGI